VSKFLNSEISNREIGDEIDMHITALENDNRLLKLQLEAVTEQMLSQAMEIARLKVELIQIRLANQPQES
jgi:DNA integrity scanning protein DisA with diadenylate cyclase activity